MEINQQLKGVHNRVKMGNIKWATESQLLEGIVITILQLSKTISTHEGNVEMPNISMVWYLYQILNSNNPYSLYRNQNNILLFAETESGIQKNR